MHGKNDTFNLVEATASYAWPNSKLVFLILTVQMTNFKLIVSDNKLWV